MAHVCAGAYVILFIMSIWATYRYTSVAQRRLRQVSMALCVFFLRHRFSEGLTQDDQVHHAHHTLHRSRRALRPIAEYRGSEHGANDSLDIRH